MKILNVNHTIDPVNGGGTAERTFQMSQQLIDNGYSCSILTMTEGAKPRVLRGGQIVVIPTISKRFFIPKFLFRGVYSAVKDADVIHLMGHWTLLNAMVYMVARWLNKPYVFCPAGALPIFGRSKYIKRVYNFIVGRRIARNAAKCIAITDVEVTHFADYDVPRDKIVIIPNAVETPTLQPKSQNQIAKTFSIGSRPFILFVGRLSLIKGPDLLVQAFCENLNSFADFDLVVAGPDDGMLDELKAIVKKYEAGQRVHFVGYIGGRDKFEAYQAATLLAIPSRQEAMSLVVLEAGIVGTPAVFTDQCGLDDFAKEGCGWMVPASVDGLAQGLRAALGNRAAIEGIGTRVRENVEKKFSWKAIIREYQQLYGDLLAQKSGTHLPL